MHLTLYINLYKFPFKFPASLHKCRHRLNLFCIIDHTINMGALAGYLLTVCRLDFRLWVLATRAHTRGVRLPLQTLTSLGSRAAGGLLSCDCCTFEPPATLWCPDRDAWFVATTYSVKVTSAVPPDSSGIAFWRKCSSISYIAGKHRCWTRQ